MPVHECEEDGKPGYQWGSRGACYTYTDEASRKKAKQRAYLQGSAISHGTGEPMKAGTTELAHMHKAFHPAILPPLDKLQALSLINELAQETVDASDVYIGRAQLANDQVDRSGERFPVEYLDRFAATLPGKPLLLGHDKQRVPAGRWFHASLARDTSGVTHLVADFYLDQQSEAVRLLKLGIAKDMSIGFLAAGRVCDRCGAKVGRDNCCEEGHRLNSLVEGVRVTATYAGDLEKVEALEGSLVGVGCQIGAMAIAGKADGAGVVLEAWEEVAKADSGAEDEMEKAELEARIKVLEDEAKSFAGEKAFAEDGREYRKDLLEEIERKAGVLERNIDLDKSLLSGADLKTLKAYDAQLTDEVNKRFQPGPRSKMLGGGAGVLPELGGDRPKGGEAVRDPFFIARGAR
jgi:hypothetical protein